MGDRPVAPTMTKKAIPFLNSGLFVIQWAGLPRLFQSSHVAAGGL